MIVNPEKSSQWFYQGLVTHVHTVEIDGNKIETTNSVDLLGIHIDNKLIFDDHIFTLCNKASMQLNAVGWLKQLGKKELKVIINTVLYIQISTIYCPLVWH